MDYIQMEFVHYTLAANHPFLGLKWWPDQVTLSQWDSTVPGLHITLVHFFTYEAPERMALSQFVATVLPFFTIPSEKRVIAQYWLQE